MKTYLLIMSLFNPLSDQYDTYVLDLGLSAEACITELNTFQMVHNPNVIFTCEEDF